MMDAPPRAQAVMSEESGEARPGLLIVDASGLVPDAMRHRLEHALREVRHEGLGCVPPAQL